jgi:hypothetical protein
MFAELERTSRKHQKQQQRKQQQQQQQKQRKHAQAAPKGQLENEKEDSTKETDEVEEAEHEKGSATAAEEEGGSSCVAIDPPTNVVANVASIRDVHGQPICPVQDGAFAAPQPGGPADGAAGGEAGGAQVMVVDGLGKFVVSTFADGFLVTRSVDGETIELSNLGSPLAMVRNTFGNGKHQHHRTMFADRSGSPVECSVTFKGYRSVLGLSALKGLLGAQTRNAQCAPAMFGPTGGGKAGSVCERARACV